jgi:hypothetical protein
VYSRRRYDSVSIYYSLFTIYHYAVNPANIAIRGVPNLPGKANLG